MNEKDKWETAALNVEHGSWPTFAYRIEINRISLGYGSDQTGR